MSERYQKNRSVETPAAKRQRLQKDSQRKRVQRSKETEEEKEVRINLDVERRRERQARKRKLDARSENSIKKSKQLPNLNILKLSSHGTTEKMVKSLTSFDCGALDQKCPDCGSYNFSGEALKAKRKGKHVFSICCGHGRVQLEKPLQVPLLLKRLLLKRASESNKFFENIYSWKRKGTKHISNSRTNVSQNWITFARCW